MNQQINYQGLPAITVPYVHAVKHRQTLYVSGLTAFGTESQNGDLLLQTQNILEQTTHILSVENRTKADLIKLIIFVKDIIKLAVIREILTDFYGAESPVSSLVEVSNLVHPNLLIEIEAIIALQ